MEKISVIFKLIHKPYINEQDGYFEMIQIRVIKDRYIGFEQLSESNQLLLRMENQKAVFNLCPILNHQNSIHMQELLHDLNQDTVQATLDICLHLTYFRNLTHNKLGPVQLLISVVSQQLAIAVPYQIISNKSYQSFSKIDLQTYTSSLYMLQPCQTAILDEMVIFKIHVPIDQVETGKLKVTVALETIDEMCYENQDKRKRLSEVTFKFNSILYIDSFLPCLFQQYGIVMEGNIYTHLLGCKYSNFQNIYRHHFYQAIDHLVISYNKLREKTSPSNMNDEMAENDKEFQQLPSFIDMKKYPEFDQIRGFIEKRIFQQKSMVQHRHVLEKFVSKFIPQMREKLLIIWKLFLKKVNFSFLEQSREQFYDKLTLELKKRVEYKVQNPHSSLSQIQKKTNFSQINYPPHCTSIVKSEEKVTYPFIENEMALNGLKQSFNDRPKHSQLKKIHVTNLQMPYPNIKIRVSQTLKIIEKQYFQTVPQPHIVVFVHGLGASSNAFNQFQLCLKNLYWKNVIVLNSVCNQNSIDSTIQEMGNKLSHQITQFIVHNNFGQHFQLSFIGHSLGGLIIRAALPKLQEYKYNMKTLITLSTPHLGYFYHNSALNKAGMWAISKFSDNKIINDLLMADQKKQQRVDQQTGYRNSYLYSLSLNKGIGWFENVMFCGSLDDYFVSPLSAFATTRESIQMKKDLKSKIWQEMRTNIEANFINCNIYRLLVEFGEKNDVSIKDQLIGRASHIMYLSSKDFISYVLLAYKDMFV